MNSQKLHLSPYSVGNETFPVMITEKAQTMAERACLSEGEGNLFLRISVRGGGCAGLQYNLDIDDKSSRFDIVSQFNGLKVAIDMFSLRHLKNTTIDYQETLEGAGFKFHNPNARKTCGCGSSFSG